MKTYKITASGKSEAGPCNIQCDSKGTAIDYFLAIHGMLWYDKITIEDTEEEPDESFGRVQELYTSGGHGLSDRIKKSLDEYHLPRVTDLTKE